MYSTDVLPLAAASSDNSSIVSSTVIVPERKERKEERRGEKNEVLEYQKRLKGKKRKEKEGKREGFHLFIIFPNLILFNSI